MKIGAMGVENCELKIEKAHKKMNPWACKITKGEHVYKLCIGIDLVNDNQYWTILINSATRECSTDPIHRAHLVWSNKTQLQLWNYKTSCKQLLVPIGHL